MQEISGSYLHHFLSLGTLAENLAKIFGIKNPESQFLPWYQLSNI